eukprot:CAMPEP_0117014734 /NCGR_PEP_ID=MMETSP0472-20121206/11897_1 /TAXON_ID=693140 ORGANISM="Tiarina fusus, Strain LIS" /NCGR_SAMPLE_ID=MMETSP0472 /ASSEMBLY_ACC=CAM_ASM_000603 /LENGTH=573 /DNA_ID=CAMNT_0004718365 /DNA_START=91 /DNA_END=1813 /DNA_ORIENTATION=-
MSSSMLGTVIAMLCLGVTTANCSSNRTCLDIQLVDMYGDGWDGEKFFIETPWNEMFSDAPTCGGGQVSHTFCTDASGNYPMMLIHENESYTPENYWEDLFTVSVSKCNETVATYTGGYNSTMIFHYEAQSDEWSVVYWENLWESQKKCDACSDARACKPKSKGASKKAKKPASATSKPIDSSHSNSTKVVKQKPRYGPPAVNVRVSMFDSDGWWQENYRGASWYLADDRRTTLFHTGSLCSDSSKKERGRHRKGGASGYCSLCLGDGSYSMRFSGEASSSHSDRPAWDFCGVQGSHAQELTFHIKKGKCIADSLLGLEADCYGTVVSTVTVSGVLNLVGLTSEFVESSQFSFLPGVLADSVVGWESKNIEVQSTTLTSRALSPTEMRRLAEFDVDVQFSASFESEADYGVEGRMYSKVKNLVSTLQDSLSSKVSAQGFSVSLAQSASLAGAVSLEKVQSAELVSLDLISISYEGVQTMQASTLPAFDDSQYWGSSVLNVSLYDAESLSVFFIAVVGGFVAFVGLLSHGVNGYKSVSQLSDSQHEVLPSEIDATISNPMFADKSSLRTELAASL